MSVSVGEKLVIVDQRMSDCIIIVAVDGTSQDGYGAGILNGLLRNGTIAT